MAQEKKDFQIPEIIRSKTNTLLIICCSIVSIVSPVSSSPVSLVQLSPKLLNERIASIQSGDSPYFPAWEQLKAEAETALTVPLQDIRKKPFEPPEALPQDYVSVGTYLWPNESDPKAPWIYRDGQKSPEVERFDRPKLVATYETVATLGFAYAFSKDERYAKPAAEHLRHWFLNPTTRMNPHLRHGQFHPNLNSGTPYGIIDTAALAESYFFDAVLLLEGSPSWSSKDQDALRQWFREYLDWLLTSDLGKAEAATDNNHATGYDYQVISMALFLGDTATAHRVAEECGPRRIEKHILADGTQPREMSRTRSMGYSAKNLNYLLQIAYMTRHLGTDLASFKSSTGVSLRTVIDAQIPYWIGEKSWPGQQITKFQWDRPYKALRLGAALYEDSSYTSNLKKIKGLTSDDIAKERLTLLLP